jgi:hypothetical protein
MENKGQTEWAKLALLPKPSYNLCRFDSNGKRFYYWPTYDANNNRKINTAVGITTLLSQVLPSSPYLTNWKIENDDWEEKLDDASAFGTLLHELFFEWFNSHSVPQEMLDAAREFSVRNGGGYDLPERNMLSFIKWVEDFNVTPLLIEAMLLSPEIEGEQYALSLDLYCELDIPVETTVTYTDGVYKSGPRKGEAKIVEEKKTEIVRRRALVDYKSNFFDKEKKSFYESHKYQLIAAKRAIQYNYPEEYVDFIGNFSPGGQWKKEPSYTLKWWNVTDKDEQVFDTYIKIGLLEGYFKPKGHIFVPPQFNPETKSTDYEILSYEEYTEKYLLPQEITVNDEI